MRALAITGIETAAMIESIMSGSLIRDTPPWARMSAGTRSSAITATAPASSAILAWSAVTTSMMTPPLSISAMPRLTRLVPCSMGVSGVCSAMARSYGSGAADPTPGSALGRRPGQRLPAYDPDPLDDRHGGSDRQRPERDVEQDRQVEDVGEERRHEHADEAGPAPRRADLWGV